MLGFQLVTTFYSYRSLISNLQLNYYYVEGNYSLRYCFLKGKSIGPEEPGQPGVQAGPAGIARVTMNNSQC